jgi:amino acid transporter
MAHKHSIPENPPSKISRKGLAHGSMGLTALVTVGVSCVAPAYALTATMGPTVSVVGEHMPAVFLLGFLPMLLVALGYRELNADAPDSGTSFTWATKAFGPHVGWLGGWGLVSATIIVLSNLAGIAVEFFYLLLAEIFRMPEIAEWGHLLAVNIGTSLLFVAGTVWLCYRGATASKAVQYVLVLLQVVALVWYSVAAWRMAGDTPALAFSWDWFNPFSIGSFGAFAAGISLSIFIYWGWDVCLTMNEETTDGSRTPGRAAGLVIFIILALYLMVSVATMRFAGLGETGLGLSNPNTRDNVLAQMAEPVMGPFAMLVAIAVLASSLASLQSTFVSPARTLLAMGHYRAIGERYAWVHPKYRSPGYATVVAGVVAGGFYAVMHAVSQHVLADTILTLGMMICFYYGLTAFACVFYFRKTLFLNARNFFLRGLAPLSGGSVLAAVFLQTAMDSMNPEFGSGSSVFGVGLVFLLGVGIILLGVVTMLLISWHRPGFFRGETLRRDTPSFTERVE